MKRIIIALPLFLFLISCDKNEDDSYTINGVVLDWDLKTPIPGAKIYAATFSNGINAFDSTLSDGGGKYNFVFPDKTFRPASATKTGYQNPFHLFQSTLPSSVEKNDTLYLTKSSYLNVTIHRTNSYPVTDSIEVFFGKYCPASQSESGLINSSFYHIKRRIANAVDTLVNVTAAYHPVPGNKVYFYWNIIRNGNIISTHSDSTDLIQYGTKNYTVNY
ncbi:hypothetical protein CAP36_02095 [Chitinophagaceae bacterium IBVUCB2]|nr:hypothetical protein CAP36_02095 [Chitinophagaceae bacterium IBVUCB2]